MNLKFWQPSTAKLWQKHRDEFLKIYAHEQTKPITHSQLEECFVDRNGKRYYRFPDSIALPIERLGKKNQISGWISAGMDGSEMRMFLDEIDKALMDGFTDKKKRSAARIGSICEQMRERERMVIHSELLYNYLACQWIREDEQPDVYNNEIQLQKVAQFKEEVGNSNSYFFFQVKELKKLNSFLNFTDEEWNQYFQESQERQKALLEALQTYSGKE